MTTSDILPRLWHMEIREDIELYLVTHQLLTFPLMRSGKVVADLRQLWPDYRVPYVPELIEAKRQGEHRPLGSLVPIDLLRDDVVRLQARLAEEAAASHLPERPSGHDALHDLVVNARLGG